MRCKSPGCRGGYFRDKLVVVGVRPEVGLAGAARDEFGNPYYRFGSSTSPGAAVHALSLLNLLRGDWLRRLSFLQEFLIIALWGLAIMVLFMRLPPWPAIGAALFSSAVFASATGYLQLRYHFW